MAWPLAGAILIRGGRVITRGFSRPSLRPQLSSSGSGRSSYSPGSTAIDLSINVKGLPEVRGALQKLAAEEINIAIAAGLNRTALRMQRRSITSMPKALDRPTPFTLNAVGLYKADRNRRSAKLFIRPIQARYLKSTIRGGTLPTILEPVQIKLDRHGNIRGKRKGMEAIARQGRNRFVAEINGITGVWQRVGPKGRKLKLLAKVERNARRHPQWDFFGNAEATARRHLRDDVAQALDEALKLTEQRARW
jgi:hypothetical protein